MLMLIATTLAPPAPVQPCSTDAASVQTTAQREAAFGMRFHVSMANIRLAQDNKSIDGPDADPFVYCLAILHPTIMVYASPCCMCLNIKAVDLGVFEMQWSDHVALLKHLQGNGSSAAAEELHEAYWQGVGPRYGSHKYCIPFIHRTTLHCPWDHAVDEAKDNPFGSHVFDFQLMLSDENSDVTALAGLVTKSMELHLTLQDVTIRYDPSSVWLLKIMELLTPAPPPVSAETEAKTATPEAYRVTKVGILVSRFMIDYASPQTPSRCLFSVGLLTLACQVVSTSPQIGFKFTVHDVALHLSNSCNDRLHPELEQHPLDATCARFQCKNKVLADVDSFMDAHDMVQLCTFDFIELVVVMHDKRTGAGLLISTNIGVCCLYACIDSLNVFTVRWAAPLSTCIVSAICRTRCLTGGKRFDPKTQSLRLS